MPGSQFVYIGRKIVAYISGEIEPNYEKSRARETTLPGFQFIDIEVFSNDFADVDLREELCYHSRPKKQKTEGR